MAEDTSHSYDDLHDAAHAARQAETHGGVGFLVEGNEAAYPDRAHAQPGFGARAPYILPSNPAALLGGPRVNTRANAPVRTAVMRQMQQQYGNRAVQRFLQRQVADQDPLAGDGNIAGRIRAAANSGTPLDTGVQRRLETGLGADLSAVRVHTGGEADHLARSVSSIAFTSGSDIFFREGAYNPSSAEGLRLLAHETTHTVQQSAGPVAGTAAPGGVSISDPSDSYEQAAEKAADSVMAGGASPAAATAAASTSAESVQRADEQAEEDAPVQTVRDLAVPFVQRVLDANMPLQRCGAAVHEGCSCAAAAPAQRAATPEDERQAVQTAAVQRDAAPEEEEEPVQTMREPGAMLTLQREAVPEEEEEPVQTMREPGATLTLQREAVPEEEEEPVQQTPVQREAAPDDAE